VTSVLTGAAGPAILEAIDRHERESSAAYARALGGRVEDRSELLVYVTGLPAFFANGVKSPRLTQASAEGTIQEVSEILSDARVPGTWVVGPLATPFDLGERLERAGLRRVHDLPWMAANILDMDLGSPPPPFLAVHRVDGEDAHRGWLRAMEQGFGLDDATTTTIDRTARAVGFDASAGWVRFVGTVEGRVVASSGVMLFGGLAGVYNVATLPEARRQGFGAALTRAALRHGRDRGYRVAALGTSDLGRSVYERMGFRDVGVVRQFVFDPSSR
jgi:ribosomal protein S18 acetylase RimI-like enzyme